MEAIGVFDSGVGGLTVLKELREILPHEHYIYFADTKNLPYGPKPNRQIQDLAQKAVDHFLDLGIKGLVIACNTATGAALHLLEDQLDIPIIGVIEPGAKVAMSMSREKTFCLLATQATVKRGLYKRYLMDLDKDAKVLTQACPHLVTAVEDGFGDHYIGRTMAYEYLDQVEGDYDTLILGCTHFPLAMEGFKDYFRDKGRDVTIVDPAKACALEAKAKIPGNTSGPLKIDYYCSGDRLRFKEVADKLLNEDIRVRPWK